MDQNNVGGKHLLDVVSSVEEVRVCRKTDRVNTHLTHYVLFSNLDELVRVHHLLSERTFYTVTSKDNSILFVRGPLKEQVTTESTLEHTRTGHHD